MTGVYFIESPGLVWFWFDAADRDRFFEEETARTGGPIVKYDRQVEEELITLGTDGRPTEACVDAVILAAGEPLPEDEQAWSVIDEWWGGVGA